MRAHRTLIVSLVLALVLAVPAGALGRAPDHRRLDLGPAARAETRHRLPQGLPEDPRAAGRRRPVGHRHQRRRQRALRHRRLLARPDLGVDPHGPRLHQDRARRRVHDHQQRQPDRPTSPRKGRRDLHRPHPRLERSPGREDLAARSTCSTATAPRVPQDAFQHIFLGETLKISPSATAETSNGLEQNAVASDKQAIGFVSFAYTAGVNAVGYQGIACNLRNAKSGQYGGVRNFWMVTKGAPKGEAAKFIRWVTSGNTTSRKRSSTRAGSPVH